MKQIFKKISAAFLFSALTLTIAGCGANEEGQKEQQGDNHVVEEQIVEKVRMASWSNPIAEQSNLYVAEEKGWFEEAGLEFEYIPGQGGGDAVRNIIAGNADIAFANVEAVLLALEKGEKLRVIYNIYPENVFNLVSLKGNNITSIEDLRGKHVGVYSRASGTYDNLLVLLHKAGMTEEDITIVDAGVLNFGPLMNNQVAATAATDTGLFSAQLEGLGEVDVIEVKDVLNTPADVFVVTEKVFNEKQDMLLRFLQVYRDSVSYTMENPEEAAETAVLHAIDGQNVERNLGIIQIRNQTSTNEEMEEKGLGWLNLDILKEVEETYYNLGLLNERVKIETITTNELVEQLK
ncbi:nitrate ABC transporter substrate-binding protein [Anaerobacillus alkalilacustris]|uniref:Nitrate ABC transporter substrate-binding protein n=1 Tax=Anaerobacillus alkalilacustris TaxID=393763 RepID=A0A1S2LPW2_9BACI|nr:ABC transporter substrate-binding protein [Anaerobacillus alkalilacustris]OIJ14416.1 nitrate ABC transporter substrate-binding protein [Anaerobacillus alkalilacustris]